MSKVRDKKEKMRNPRIEKPTELPNPLSDKKPPQATPEQMRYAVAASTEKMSEEDYYHKEKIQQVISLTGRSEDDVALALHDCDYDTNSAVNKLLEEAGSHDNAWQEFGTKKKKKQGVTASGKDVDLKDEPPKSEKPKEPRIKDDRGRDNSAPRGRSNKPPRMSRGSANNTWKGKENEENEKNRTDSRSAERRGGGRGRGGPRSDRGDVTASSAGGMMNLTGDRGDIGGASGGRGRGRSRGARGGGPRGQGFGRDGPQIDTWCNEQAEEKKENGWADIDEWNNDEWTGTLDESKVFTPTISASNSFTSSNPQSAALGDGKNNSTLFRSPPQNVFNAASMVDTSAGLDGSNSLANNILSSTLPGQQSAMTSLGQGGLSQSLGQPAIGQRVDLGSLFAKSPTSSEAPAPTSSRPSESQFHNSLYAKQAAESIKSQIGIRSGAMDSVPTAPQVRSAQSLGQSSAPSSQQQQQARSKPARSKVPPPSKIPQSAVEMPEQPSGTYNVDVQFGHFDFGASGGSESLGSISAGSDSHYVSGAASGAPTAVNGSSTSLDGQSSLYPATTTPGAAEYGSSAKVKPITSPGEMGFPERKSSPYQTRSAPPGGMQHGYSSSAYYQSSGAPQPYSSAVYSSPDRPVAAAAADMTYSQISSSSYPTSVSFSQPNSVVTSSVVTQNGGGSFASAQLAESLGKLSVSEGDASSAALDGPSFDGSVSSSTAASSSSLSSSVTVTPSLSSNTMVTSSTLSAGKSGYPVTSKAPPNLPQGIPPVMGNYMMPQGIPFPFGLQQPMYGAEQYQQLLLSGDHRALSMPGYYDNNLPFQQTPTTMGAAGLASASSARGDQAAASALSSYSGMDALKSRVDAQSPTSLAAAQSVAPPAQTHPANFFPPGYSYYPYASPYAYPMPFAQHPLPTVTTPTAHGGGSTSNAQFPKTGAYNSHTTPAYGHGLVNSGAYDDSPQLSDFKNYGGSSQGSKAPVSAAIYNPSVTSEMNAYSKPGTGSFDKSFTNNTPPPFQNVMPGAGAAAAGGGTMGAPIYTQYVPQQMMHQLQQQLQKDSATGGATRSSLAQSTKNTSKSYQSGGSSAYWGGGN